MTHCVYLLTSSENKFYVGVTSSLQRRIRAHLSGNGSKLVKEAIERKITFEHHVLFEGTEIECYDAEPNFISEFNSLAPLGYNIDTGGRIGGVSDRRGSKNTQAVLSEEIVLEIRELYSANDITQEVLAHRYGVCRETISALVRGKSWKNVGGPLTFKTNASRKLDQESIDLIRLLRYEDGLTYDQISLELGIPRGTVAKYGSSRV